MTSTPLSRGTDTVSGDTLRLVRKGTGSHPEKLGRLDSKECEAFLPNQSMPIDARRLSVARFRQPGQGKRS